MTISTDLLRAADYLEAREDETAHMTVDEAFRISGVLRALASSQWQDIAGWKLVPIEPTEAMLRPFYECPPDELPLAWAAALRIARPPLSASPEDKP